MRKFQIILFLFIFFLACNPKNISSSSQEATKTFKNPLLTSGPDPWVIQKDGFYYLLYTTNENISIRKTKAMSEVSSAQPVIVWTPPNSGPNAFNIWAPELHFVNGKWYIYYTAGPKKGDFQSQRIFVLENNSQDPTRGAWEDRGKIFCEDADLWSIDGTVVNYQGNNYFVWCSVPDAKNFIQCIYISRMKDPVTLTGARVKLTEPKLAWERNGDPKINEGPEALINPKGKLFLTYSASACWTNEYAIGLLSLKKDGDPMDPSHWMKSDQPVFMQKPQNGAFGTGHNGFFKSPDGKEDWIIYHANSESGQGCVELRSPRIQPFSWKKDGTPDFGEPLKINAPIKKPSGE